jgi:hypothetical protein
VFLCNADLITENELHHYYVYVESFLESYTLMQTVINAGVGFATEYCEIGNVLLYRKNGSYTVEGPDIAHVRLDPSCTGRDVQSHDRFCNP